MCIESQKCTVEMYWGRVFKMRICKELVYIESLRKEGASEAVSKEE